MSHIHLLSGTLVLLSLPPTISRPPSCAHVWRVTCLRLWLLGADECCMLGEGGLFTIARVGCMVATQKGVQIQVNRGRSTPKMTRAGRSCAHVPERSIKKNARPILVEIFERLRSTEGFYAASYFQGDCHCVTAQISARSDARVGSVERNERRFSTSEKSLFVANFCLRVGVAIKVK